MAPSAAIRRLFGNVLFENIGCNLRERNCLAKAGLLERWLRQVKPSLDKNLFDDLNVVQIITCRFVLGDKLPVMVETFLHHIDVAPDVAPARKAVEWRLEKSV
jgi:hypothetical protein